MIRIPITVMERAGSGDSVRGQEMMAAGYIRIVKIAVGVILILVCLKLGVAVPWKELVNLLLGWIFGY